jgi:hypothetical protein
MREVVEIDWVSERATLEFYISCLDSDHEHLAARIMSSCDDALQKVHKAENIDIFLLNTGEGSRSLVTMITNMGKAKGLNIEAIGF